MNQSRRGGDMSGLGSDCLSCGFVGVDFGFKEKFFARVEEPPHALRALRC